ncbi:bifunctional folylpolyglutamate synthase/dihydrofolate synthase [Pseudodesulfovibrio sediminis]|uniref:Dihydrofolate synthase/folylpolyglutamate synthase n=1 Tax=Pseudodesulfovibrio sediminis TaxID=2810563 RepID=A0ABM7P4Q5_9BACT|nr:bifunctional folylpolyglutamate synthase/dihydrofolate synthase [Pseudodesulfovibrio sediminis]BCS87751.1 hypothetical protein PSDVSF_09930 [Pseudodesulfovibrio sediminis]
MKKIENYSQLTRYMDELGLFHMDLSLTRMEQFWAARGPVKIPIIHVVGTNGKGSTSAFLGSIGRAHGLKVGMFTSPHFLSSRERVQVNRRQFSREAWVDLANEVLSSPGGDALTYFEFQTCLAMVAFQQENVDLAIMEAGLGGAYDATNVFKPGLTLYTPIGMDHEKILGPTLMDIARDKAGAMHTGGFALTGPQEGEVMVLLEDCAKSAGARLVYAVDVAEPVRQVNLGLRGMHQSMNAHLALAGWRWFAADQEIPSESAKERFGLETAFVPGRYQSVTINGQDILLDGAHNKHALIALKAALDADDLKPGCVIFACLADKDVDSMLPLVRNLTSGPIIVPGMESERARDAAELADLLGGRVSVSKDMESALIQCANCDGTTLVCGSLYLLAEFYTLHPHFLTV